MFTKRSSVARHFARVEAEVECYKYATNFIPDRGKVIVQIVISLKSGPDASRWSVVFQFEFVINASIAV